MLTKVLASALFVMIVGVTPAISNDVISHVTLNGTTYKITSMGRGQMFRVDDAEGHMIGMARVQGDDISILHPQQEPGFSIVKSVVIEYLHPSNGAAPPAPADVVQHPSVAPVIPTAAVMIAGGGARSVTSFTDAGVVVHDPDLRADVTISPDGMRGSWIIQVNGAPPVRKIVEYEGGDKPASEGQKIGKATKGGLTAVFQSRNTRADATVNVSNNPDKSWRILAENGSKKETTFESGGKRTGGYVAYTGRDPAQQIGIKELHAFRLDVEAAKDAAGKQGQASKFDLSSERSQRGWNALLAATKAYDLK